MASPFDDVQHFLSFRVELNTINLAAPEFLITPPSKCHDKIGQFLHNCFNICPLKRQPVGYTAPFYIIPQNVTPTNGARTAQRDAAIDAKTLTVIM